MHAHQNFALNLCCAVALSLALGHIGEASAAPPTRGDVQQLYADLEALEGDIARLRGSRKTSTMRRLQRLRRRVGRWMGVPSATTKLPPALGEEGFEALYDALDQAPEDRARLRVLSEAAAESAFTVAQVGEIVGRFAFSREQIEAARLLIPRIVDPESGYRLFELFPRADDRRAVRQILEDARQTRQARETVSP
ncbi:MAG: DUF4476 domain-containing protein [Bradymonadia bacterium]